MMTLDHIRSFLFVLLVLAGNSALAAPTQPSESNGAPPPEVKPFEKIDPLLVGPASDALKKPMVLPPTSTIELPKEIGFPRALLACPDGSGCLILDSTRDDDRIFKVDAKSGKTIGNATELAVRSFQPKFSRAGNRWALVRTDAGEIIQVDANSGAVVRRIAASEGSRNSVVRGTGDALARVAAGKIIIVDLSTGKETEIALLGVKERELIPIAFSKDAIVVCAPRDESAVCFAIDPNSGKLLAQNEMDLGPCVSSADGALIASVKIKDEGWDRVTVWDRRKLTKASDREFVPKLASIGLQLSDKGSLLLVHEYMVQPVFLWSPEAGKIIGMLGPDGYGVSSFDLSPDGKRAVAIAGQWRNGTLVPGWITTYDLPALIK